METHSIRGIDVPTFFYGTAWKEERTEELSRLAIASGFRAIDTANQRKHYYEEGVGKAIAGHDDLFLQTKFTYARGQDHRLPYDSSGSYGDQVRQSFTSSLAHLGVDVIDSYVLHGPSGRFELSEADVEVWRAMEALHDEKKARLLGTSNTNVQQLKELCHRARVKPAFIQNRCFARDGWDLEVRRFCRANDIVYQGFSLLTANRHELASPTIQNMVERTGFTTAQLVFSFALHVGMIPLTGTTSEDHMREDLASLDLELNDDDVAAIEQIGR